MGVPDDEASVVWNDLNICERFGWQIDYVRCLSAKDYHEAIQYLDARLHIASSITKGE